MRRFIIIGIILIVLIFSWHLYLTNDARRIAREASTKSTGTEAEISLSINPITNVINMTLTMPPSEIDKDNPWAEVGKQLGTVLVTGLIKTIEPMAERELNTKAREHLDIYALMVPYRLRITLKEPDEEAIERFRARRKEQLEAEEQQKREIARQYISEGLKLENVRVATGERFGRSEVGVFGTIVNGGAKTLSQVKVRVYFLDSGGRRIGEKDYSPVLVTTLGIGDNTPLRPGYRKDFGYSLRDYAPSGWAKEIEAEIIEIAFQEETS